MTDQVAIACTLRADEIPERRAAARSLGAEALIGVQASDRRARLTFDGQLDRIETLVAAESRCCPFFEFAIGEDAGGLVQLDIETPTGGELPLRALIAGIVSGWEEGSDV